MTSNKNHRNEVLPVSPLEGLERGGEPSRGPNQRAPHGDRLSLKHGAVSVVSIGRNVYLGTDTEQELSLREIRILVNFLMHHLDRCP